MRTAYYTADFLAPLGAEADRRVTHALLLAWIDCTTLTRFADPDPSQTALERLMRGVRDGQYELLLLRWVADLCLTTDEVFAFVGELGEAGVRVEVACHLLPAALFASQPARLGRFRARQAVAKILRLRGSGMGVEEIARAARVSRRRAVSVLSARRLLTPGSGR